MTHRFVLTTVFALLFARLVSGQNIHPDPGFETTGVAGSARSGQKAGHVKIDARQHWVCIGGSLTVEPFTTYRVSAWVIAKPGTGSLFALYCYDWNSFDWAFGTNVPLKETTEWTKVEATFVSPNKTMNVHPLAAIGAVNSEAWVDDVVVEKVLGVEETMRPLLAKETLSNGEQQLLARYYVWRNESEKAKALMEKAEDYTKADIACLLAKHTSDPAQRQSSIADMVRFGGLGYSNGVTRFDELTTGLTTSEKLQACGHALLAAPNAKTVWNAYRGAVERNLKPNQPLTCSEMDSQIASLAAAVKQTLDKLPEGAVSQLEREAMKKAIEDADQALAQRRKSLGRCIVKIGGKQLKASTHAIVISDQATPQEEHAAKDLRHHLELVTGEAIPILKDGEVKKQIPVIVGKSSLLKKARVRVDWEELGADGILIKTSGSKLVLAGGQRGVLYACYTFLEDYLGVRWLAPDCTVHPKEGSFDLKRIKKTYVPPLEYREPFAFCGYDADWAARNMSNGSATRLDAARGGKVVYKGFVHTFFPLVPPEKHFAQHPDWFSEIGGKRQHEHAQLCLTNPEVEDELVESIKHWLRETPEANIVSVSQNDWRGNCECPKCKAIDEEEGSPAGSLLRFVNRVAERIEKEFPHMAIDTLAYQYTRKPPKLTKPRPNVIVRLCSIECSFSQPLGTSEQNKTFRADIEGWGKICRRLYVWDYVTNFAHYIQPHPNFRVLQPNIQFFVKNGVKGIFEQGGYQSPGGEFEELRTWLLAKLLWNPDDDVEQRVKEFLEGYYGPAAPFIRQYIELMHDSVEKTGTYLNCYAPPTSPFLTGDAITRAAELFDEAEKAVHDDPTVLKRVQTARLPVIYVQIVRDLSGYKEQGDTLVTERGEKSALIGRFEEIAKAAGVTHIREGGNNLEDWLGMRRTADTDLHIERLKNASLEVSLLPQVGGRIWRLRYGPNGTDLVKYASAAGVIDPSEGGYEEYSETNYRSPGWNEAYKVVERTPRHILLQTDLRNGFRLTRRVELDADKPLVSITSTLANQGKASRQACLRIHPSLSVSSTAQSAVWTRSSGGRWSSRSLANPDDPQAEKEIWFRGDERPAGEWAVVDLTNNLGIFSRFRPEQVGVCYLNWSGRESRVNLELWSAASELRPGESIEIQHSYEIEGSAKSRFGSSATTGR